MINEKNLDPRIEPFELFDGKWFLVLPDDVKDERHFARLVVKLLREGLPETRMASEVPEFLRKKKNIKK